MSGVSGFSDDFQDDDNDDGLITTSGEKKKERRDYGTISCNVYWQYVRAGGLLLLAIFLALSVALQCMKVYLDFMLGNWIGEDGSQSQDMTGFFKLFAGLSATVIVFTYSANILGQWIGEIFLENVQAKLVTAN